MNAIPLHHSQRAQHIRQALEDLNTSSADIEASALISIDGLLIDAVMPHGMDEDRLGAMSAALLSLGERTARELGRGRLERVLVQGENGYVIVSNFYPVPEFPFNILPFVFGAILLAGLAWYWYLKRTRPEVAQRVGTIQTFSEAEQRRLTDEGILGVLQKDPVEQ